MIQTRLVIRLLSVALLLGAASLRADELDTSAPELPAVTLENVVPPTANDPAEPLAQAFSLRRAVHFLDSAAVDWQKSRQCFTCHTNYSYLLARPAVGETSVAHDTVRAFAEQLVNERWPSQGPRWNAEVVATGAFLACNDAQTTGKLHAATRAALDKMWTLQREDGGWDWLKCDWPPMESDDHYGATLAAIGVGMAPEGYAQTEAAQAGLKKLQAYLQNNPPPTLHHQAMLLWASSKLSDLMSQDARQACIDQLVSLQKADGGWGLATLGDWKRGDASPQDLDSSDGYGTGFVIYVLRQAGLAADDPRLQRGIAWLKSHQRESGRWFTRSLHADSKHFITHAGTAFAVMALAACGEVLAAAQDAALPDASKVQAVKILEVDHYCEGVVFDHEGNGYISEGKQIVQFTPDGKSSVWATTPAPNGHKILADGTHLVCDAEAHAVLHLSAEGKLLEPASKDCQGQPLRGPNDLTLDSLHGGFYFTDPGDSGLEKPIGTLHYVDASGKTLLLDEGFAYPNGVALTSDGKRLYMAESQKNRVLVYEVTGPGQVTNRQVLIELPNKDEGAGQVDNQPDGMCLDAAGNLYVAHYGMRQVQVVSPEGKLLARYAGGNLTTSNVAFGGPKRDTLYVTGGLDIEKGKGGLFRLDLGVKGLKILPDRK